MVEKLGQGSLLRSGVGSLRDALASQSGPALVAGTIGSALITIGGFGAGAVPTSGGPATQLGLNGATFGHGAALALVITWIGVAILVVAWLSLGPRAFGQVHPGRQALPSRDALWATALWSIPLLVSVPVFSRDAWSYLAQGALLSAGVSPYEFGPGTVPGSFTDQVSPDWRSTATPYGPVHLLAMRIIAALAFGEPMVGVVLLRLAVLAALCGLCVAVIKLARLTGTRPAAAVWISAASPLSILHFVGGLHNEIFPLLGAVIAVIFAMKGRIWLAAVMIGLALSVKVTAVVVAPFLLWLAAAHSARNHSPSPRRTWVANCAVLAVIPGVVTVALSLASGTGLGWVSGLAVSDRVVNYLSLPTGAAHLYSAAVALTGVDSYGFDDVLVVARLLSRAVLAITLVAIWWRARHSPSATLRGIVGALLAFVILNTVSWPWYHAWIGGFWAAARPSRVANALAAGAVVFLVLAIGPNGSTSLYTPGLVIVSVLASGATSLWWLHSAPRLRPQSEIRAATSPSPGPDA